MSLTEAQLQKGHLFPVFRPKECCDRVANHQTHISFGKKMEKNSARVKSQVLHFVEVDKIGQELLKCSIEAGKASYCPYSKFAVGAALLCENDEIYRGCNVENSSFGLTVCAEQTALVKAISDGKMNFKAIAVSADSEEITTPCGKCRQFIYEFGTEIKIYCARPDLKEVLVTSSSGLLPHGFRTF